MERAGAEQGDRRVGVGWVPSILEQALSVQGNVTRAGCRGPARPRGVRVTAGGALICDFNR